MNTRGFAVRSRSSKSKGFSLVEVLVSIIVLSFGMLGIVGMQAYALQANRDARLQSTATVLARELGEMMRGNQTVGVMAANNPYFGDFNTSPMAPATRGYCLNVGSTCADTIAVANAQMTEWLSRVDAELPGARVEVCFDSAPYTLATGIPKWGCTAGSVDVAVIKIGWSRGSTDRSATGASAIREVRTGNSNPPSIVFTITSGSTDV
jgi:type IV pilus assembly protein PilV